MFKAQGDDPVVGAIVNGELRELTYRIEMDANISLMKTSEADGARIYRRSLTFLLESAFDDMYPTAPWLWIIRLLQVDITAMCWGVHPLDEAELDTLHDHMQELVEC
jgi:uridine kinase